VNLRIEPASADVLAERAAWRYPPPYDFYDDDGIPPKNPELFYGAYDEDGALVGFYFFASRGEDVFYGLGLRPDLTGRGLGLEFVRAGIAFATERFRPKRVILDVAEFNERAIRVYEQAGFRRTGKHLRGDVPFVDMELSA
jgi:RimJ/RimL family protein N-acetyltransferase